MDRLRTSSPGARDSLLAVFALAALVAACAGPPEPARCRVSSQCPPGWACDDGTCVRPSEPADAAVAAADASTSPGSDASDGDPADAGSAGADASHGDPPDTGSAGADAGPADRTDAGSGGADAGPVDAGSSCIPESDPGFCARLGRTCGRVTGVDDCGYARTADCGACTLPESCQPDNRCGDPTLAAWWKLDETSGTTAVDSSGSGYDGAMTDAPAVVAGVIGSALSFDGVDDSVDVTAAASLNPFPLTVTAWLRTGPTSAGGIVNKYRPGALNGYQLFSSDGKLCAWYFIDGSNHIWDRTGCTLAATGYGDDAWHFVAFVVDDAGGRLFVDAQQVAAQPWTGTPGPATTPQPLSIARYPGAAAEWFAGSVDEVRVYTRALSAADIASLFSRR